MLIVLATFNRFLAEPDLLMHRKDKRIEELACRGLSILPVRAGFNLHAS
jgi:hypothetical protein